MQWFVLDTIIAGVIVLSAVFAAWRGIIRTLFGLLACVLALVAALMFTSPLAAVLPFLKHYPLLSALVSFVLIFVGVLIVGGLPGGLLHRLLRSSGMGFLDRGLGFLFGVVRGVVVVLAVLWGAEFVPAIKTAIMHEPSSLVPLFEHGIDFMRPWVTGINWAALVS